MRAIVYLAGQGGSARTVSQIAEVTLVPPGYLAKVMQTLSRAGIVRSQRGFKGGFSLAFDPGQLSVLEVVNAVDPIRRFPKCPLGIEGHGKRLCPLHKQLDDAAQLVEDAFGKTMVLDLLAVPGKRKSLCNFPSLSQIAT